VYSADEVVSLDVAVAEEHPAMQAAPVQDRHLVVVPDDHEVDILDPSVCGFTIGEVAPDGDLFGHLLVGGTHRIHHPAVRARIDRPVRRPARTGACRVSTDLPGVAPVRRTIP
jgi:hypothetical protein